MNHQRMIHDTKYYIHTHILISIIYTVYTHIHDI